MRVVVNEVSENQLRRDQVGVEVQRWSGDATEARWPQDRMQGSKADQRSKESNYRANIGADAQGI